MYSNRWKHCAVNLSGGETQIKLHVQVLRRRVPRRSRRGEIVSHARCTFTENTTAISQSQTVQNVALQKRCRKAQHFPVKRICSQRQHEYVNLDAHPICGNLLQKRPVPPHLPRQLQGRLLPHQDRPAHFHHGERQRVRHPRGRGQVEDLLDNSREQPHDQGMSISPSPCRFLESFT